MNTIRFNLEGRRGQKECTIILDNVAFISYDPHCYDPSTGKEKGSVDIYTISGVRFQFDGKGCEQLYYDISDALYNSSKKKSTISHVVVKGGAQ